MPRPRPITNIGTAHIEHLGSREEIAREKGDLFAALDERACAAVNRDDPRVVAQAERVSGRTVGYGEREPAEFTARDVRVGREVIIKEPAEPSDAADAGAALRMERRLLRERRILGLMEHPAVVPIYETGHWPDGTPFFAMRRIHGPTLAETIAEARSFAERIVLLPQFISITEAIAHAHERGVVFHTDAVQTFGKLPIDVERMGIDLLSLSAHKIYGPKGTGVLYIKKGTKLDPCVHGGHQEWGKRGGKPLT